jgi:pyrroline-5-carboxylate reductase
MPDPISSPPPPLPAALLPLAVLGCGKMGGALVKGIVGKQLLKGADLKLADAYPTATEALAAAIPGAHACQTNDEALTGAATVLLAVKPGDMPTVLSQIAELPQSVLIISIAAGVKLAAMEKYAGPRHRIIRVMPNTPALVGKGAAGYATGANATKEDASFVAALLESTGLAVPVKEELLDAVTGLSGSGPAYVYTFIEALADGGLLMGLSKEQALKLAAQTVAGAAEMVLQTGLHPALLRDQVTSPGGTTIAGLATLEENGFRSALMQAVKSATTRSKELGA